MGELRDALKGIPLPSGAQKVVEDADLVYDKRRDQASYIEHLESEVKKFQAELERVRKEKGLSNARDNLTFDQRTGTYIESGSNLRYCAKCLSADKRHPLRDTGHGWHCAVCESRLHDPSRPEEVYVVRSDYDPYNP